MSHTVWLFSVHEPFGCNFFLLDTGPGLKLHSNSKMEENTPVTLTCSIDYYCPLYNISLTWDPDVNGTVKIDIKNDTREIRTTTTLTFVPSWEDNNKNISCVLQRSNETNESQTIQLDVQCRCFLHLLHLYITGCDPWPQLSFPILRKGTLYKILSHTLQAFHWYIYILYI